MKILLLLAFFAFACIQQQQSEPLGFPPHGKTGGRKVLSWHLVSHNVESYQVFDTNWSVFGEPGTASFWLDSNDRLSEIYWKTGITDQVRRRRLLVQIDSLLTDIHGPDPLGPISPHRQAIFRSVKGGKLMYSVSLFNDTLYYSSSWYVSLSEDTEN